MAGGADALAVFHNVLAGSNVPQGDFVAVGHVAVDGDNLGVTLLVPNLHLGAVRDSVRENGGHVVQIVHLQR